MLADQPTNISHTDVAVLDDLIKVSSSLSLAGSLFIILSYVIFKVRL